MSEGFMEKVNNAFNNGIAPYEDALNEIRASMEKEAQRGLNQVKGKIPNER